MSSKFQKTQLARDRFHTLFDVLHRQNYKVIGPVVRDGAVVFERVTSPDQLAKGVIDEQQPGSYKLKYDKQSEDSRYFLWNNGPQALKPLLFKPRQELWMCRADDTQLTFHPSSTEADSIAVIGVRACDLAALALQDQHFLHGNYGDGYYQAQREKMLLIAVNCSRSGEQCFCVSTGDGPGASFYYDLLLDELDDGFLLECGSDKGAKVLDQLSLPPATEEQEQRANRQVEAAAKAQSKQLPGSLQLADLAKLLRADDWKAIAERCLSCGNCTLVCPTCFCSKQEAENDLSLDHSTQVRLWDSCFSEEHGHIFGKNYRPEIASRYRQWMLHKLVFWRQQYGRIGCVGCGRCISWCPAAIDLVEEAQRLLALLPEEEQTRHGGGNGQ
ncbi:sulfite reductase subunit A [Vibrio albus]|uniref:Sulfite reductase subunit A n=1 Tax=Vibrio albus TaxID=2200953 RepID=A0A2U3BB04_9VIBR|nr:4Fe-4S dicluster domain-containing protein [Vibrio albus]PWI33971.1 sulfite reductase subunit A [Vibrio albus]